MTIFDVDIDALTDGPTELDRYRGSVALMVNVAARCGLIPQHTASDGTAPLAMTEKLLPH